MAISDTESLIIKYSGIGCNILSILGATFIISSFLIKVLPSKRHNKLATRLIFFVSINDLLFSAFQIAQLSANEHTLTFCTISMFGWVCSCLCSAFFNMCIAFNLQETFLRIRKVRTGRTASKVRERLREIMYHIFSWGFGIVISMLPFIEGMYGFDPKESVCWFRHSGTTKGIAWQVGVLFAPLSVAIVYCSIIFVVVAIKINTVTNRAKKYQQLYQQQQQHQHQQQQEAKITTTTTTEDLCHQEIDASGSINPHVNDDDDNNNNNNMSELEYSQKAKVARILQSSSASSSSSVTAMSPVAQEAERVKTAVRRLLFYPLVFVFCELFNFIVEFNTFATHDGNFWLLFLNVTTIGLQGFLNAIVFSFDASLRRSGRKGYCCYCGKYPCCPCCGSRRGDDKGGDDHKGDDYHHDLARRKTKKELSNSVVVNDDRTQALLSSVSPQHHQVLLTTEAAATSNTNHNNNSNQEDTASSVSSSASDATTTSTELLLSTEDNAAATATATTTTTTGGGGGDGGTYQPPQPVIV